MSMFLLSWRWFAASAAAAAAAIAPGPICAYWRAAIAATAAAASWLAFAPFCATFYSTRNCVYKQTNQSKAINHNNIVMSKAFVYYNNKNNMHRDRWWLQYPSNWFFAGNFKVGFFGRKFRVVVVVVVVFGFSFGFNLSRFVLVG